MRNAAKRSLWILLAFVLLWGIVPLALAAKDQPGPQALAKLTLYHSPTNTDIKLFLDAFTRKYPFVKVNSYRAGSVALMNRVATEHKADTHKWDVLILNSLFLDQLKKEGILQKYVSHESEAYGPGFKDHDGFWNGLFVNAQVLGYNTRMVKPQEVPKSFMDLLEPRWKGKIGIDAEPYEWIACLEREWGREKTWDYMEKLTRQRLNIRRGRSLLVQLLAAGEFPLAIPIYSYKIEQMKQEGASLEWAALEPVSANMLGIALAGKPNNPNTAKLFIEFVLSREGQQVVREFSRIPARLDVKPDPPRLTEGIRLVPSGPEVSGELQRVLRGFDAAVRRNQ